LEKKKILVLGASSFLGNLFLKEYSFGEVLGTYNNNKVNSSISFNSTLEDISKLEVNWNDFSHALILIGDTDPDSCYRNSELSNLINIVSIKKIIDFLVFKNIFIIFTSSEFVFDGLGGLYKETDKANPILLYGQQKLEVENYLKGIEKCCILRLAKIYGDSEHDGTLFSNWMKALNKNKNIYCANDQYFSPVYVQDVIRIIHLVIVNNITGLYHVSCGKKFRRDMLLEVLCLALEIKPKIHLCSINDFNLPEKRPLDVSLDSSKISKSLNFTFTDTEVFIKNRYINLKKS
jgi:dTDP-4-dehydrorhamnose reductase|tara:strand:+ start:339 stop:1211 length:873 start_codon:yes stop_codon:yes gene_type:complete